VGENNFNTRQCVRALFQIGFILSNTHPGSHDKFLPPKEIMEKIKGLNPRFIMIPRHAKLRLQNQIIAELRKMGGDELVAKFRENL